MIRIITSEGLEKMRQASIRGAETRKRKLLEEYIKNPKVCRYCNSPILPLENQRVSAVSGKIFCNSSCAAKFNNSLKGKYKVVCQHCNKEFESHPASTGKYCSRKCCSDSIFKKVHLIFLEGKLSDIKTIKKHLLVEKKYQCCKCENTGIWQNKTLTLELEHLDGNPENNALDNLEWICPNCHSQTDTYKSKNKGNGRFSRRQRYKEGKSY